MIGPLNGILLMRDQAGGIAGTLALLWDGEPLAWAGEAIYWG